MKLEIFDGQDVIRIERFAEFKTIQHRQAAEFSFRGTDEARSPLVARLTFDKDDIVRLTSAFIAEETRNMDGLYILVAGGVAGESKGLRAELRGNSVPVQAIENLPTCSEGVCPLPEGVSHGTCGYGMPGLGCGHGQAKAI